MRPDLRLHAGDIFAEVCQMLQSRGGIHELFVHDCFGLFVIEKMS